jgi:hypothetical protein
LSAPPTNYRRAFWKSRHHLWLAVLTLGLGFASGEPLGLLAGATAYALGLVFLPDAGFFRRAVDARAQGQRDLEAAARLADFHQQQDRLLAELSPARRQRHTQLAAVCADIEKASAEAQATTGLDLDSRLRKLDELMWTYLRMLAIEQSLDIYLETERKERVPELVVSLEAETQALAAEIESAKKITPRPPALETKERLAASRLERLNTLRQRQHRIEQALASFELVRSEQERLVEQVKLIRADAVAAKNADALSARIDLSIEHLAATNKWLSELTEFKDLTNNLPDLPVRVGYAASPTPAATRKTVESSE